MSLEAVETHVSWLVFTEDRVYKGKRPVRLDFVDLRSSAARRRACRQETVLNRRLSPDVYEGVGRFTGPDGSSEAVVVMRRLPADRRLAELARRGDVRTPAAVDAVAALMARFHRGAVRGCGIDRHCGVPALRRLWRESLATLGAFPRVAEPELVSRIGRLADGYLAGRRPLIEARVASGHAVDGHGDLLAEDIFCLDDGVRILDCLEFDERLRHVDPLADMASLAMDLERLGRPDLAGRLLNSYATDVGDEWPESLAHHWIAYRAVVRAKVAAIRWSESEAAGDAQEAGRLLALALAHLQQGEVVLVVLGGLPGAGKSTLARQLTGPIGATLLSSDSLRKREGFPPAYDQRSRSAVYRTLVQDAETALGAGRSVVMDATWSLPAWRAAARRAARRARARVVELEADAPAPTRLDRARTRAGLGGDLSDAGPEVAEALGRRFAAWPEATRLDTGGAVETAVAAALAAIRPDACSGAPGPSRAREGR